MTHERMYELSTALHELHRRYRLEDFLGFHAYRYKFFVDTSPRGRHCRYAAACIKLHKLDGERESLLDFLASLTPAVPRLQALKELLDED